MYVKHMCVCVCVFAVLATFLTTHIFLLRNYHCSDVCVPACVQCVCRELAHAHVAMPLQSQSALSCCFHSSSESQHSQPRSLPGFTLLVPARSDSLPTFFCLCGSLSRAGDTSVFPLHSFIQTESTSARETQGHRKFSSTSYP